MPQIKAILDYFGKGELMPKIFNTVSLGTNHAQPIYLDRLSIFLTPKDHVNLSKTAKNVTLRTIIE